MTDANKVGAMKNILDMMDGNGSSSTSNEQSKAMGEILSKFREATENIREASDTNDALFEALQTERTDDGVRIAEWKIKITDAPVGKFYDVIREDINIASELRLYEAALGLTRELNAGASITSPKVRKILELESKYSKSLNDAISFNRTKARSTGQKKEIAESRLSEAKRSAASAKKDLKDLMG